MHFIKYRNFSKNVQEMKLKLLIDVDKPKIQRRVSKFDKKVTKSYTKFETVSYLDKTKKKYFVLKKYLILNTKNIF